MWREVRETPFPLYRGNILVPMYNGKEAIREIHFVEWLFSEKSDQKARTAKLAKE